MRWIALALSITAGCGSSDHASHATSAGSGGSTAGDASAGGTSGGGTSGANGGGSGTPSAAGGSSGNGGMRGSGGVVARGGSAGNSSAGSAGDGSAGMSAVGAPNILPARLAAGEDFACGIDPQHAIVCWSGIPVKPPAGSFATLAAGGFAACALDSRGALACWEETSLGSDVPDLMPADTFTHISVGGTMGEAYACGIRVGGDLECWGSSGRPTLPAITTGFEKVSAGETTACGLRGGSLVCWGKSMPPAFMMGPFVDVMVGASSGCTLDAGGQVSCWGPTGLPRQIPKTAHVVQIATSPNADLACALLDDGTVVCDNLGSALDPPDPVHLSEIAVGHTFACGVRDDRSVYCWPGMLAGATPPADFHVVAR